jgi:hypothetical protein
VITDFDTERILVMYSVEDDNLLSFYDDSRAKPEIKIAEEVFQDTSDYSNMDLSFDKTTGFIGGSRNVFD